MKSQVWAQSVHALPVKKGPFRQRLVINIMSNCRKSLILLGFPGRVGGGQVPQPRRLAIYN